jgi:hypothetical protein
MLVGAQVSGWVFNTMVPDPAVLSAWRQFWMLPALFAGLVLAFFTLAFPREKTI